MDKQKKIRRSRMIVLKPLQSKIMTNVALLPFVILTLNMILVATFCWSLTKEAREAGVDLPSAQSMLIASGTFLIVSSAFIAVYVLILSNRIAGPIYAIGNVLKAVRNGETDRRCHLRKQDLLATLGDDVNEFLDWNEGKLDGGVQGTRGSEKSETETEAGTSDADVPEAAGADSSSA